MDYQSQHTMVLMQEFEDGSQEWHCPACGRRFIMQWPPNYKRTIIEEGDPNVIHSGGVGGVNMGGSEILPADNNLPVENDLPAEYDLPVDDLPEDGIPVDLAPDDDPYLAPFKDWVDHQNW